MSSPIDRHLRDLAQKDPDLRRQAGEKFLGRPPEYGMILEQMEITSTMYGGCKDSAQWVDPEAMEHIYQYLWEAVS